MSLIQTTDDIQPDSFTEMSRTLDWKYLLNSMFVGDLEIFDFLWELENDLDNTDNTVLTPLMRASYRGQTDQTEFLLDQGSDCNALTSNGLSAMMMAAFNGHCYIVDLLIRRNANYNLLTPDGMSALMLASAMGHAKTVEVLLGYRVDVNVKSKSGLTASMLATSGGFGDVVDLLIKHNADCNMVNDINKSCLIIAAENRNVRIVKSLLDNQADYTIVDENGYSALMYAAQNGFPDIVQALINKGASINTTNNKGENAFVLAVRAGHAEVVDLLIKQGADYEGGIPMPSFSHSRNLELQELAFGRILDLVADAVQTEPWEIDEILQNHNGLKTYLKDTNIDEPFDEDTSIKIPALILATQLDFIEVVRVLLEQKADINVQDKMGNTSLMIACYYGNSGIAKLLINAHSNVNLKNKIDLTALHMAAENGIAEIVEMLIEKQCDLEAKAKHGVNALLLACFYGHDNIVELLLRNDVNCNCVLNNGVSPLMLASNRGFSNIVTQLLEKDSKIDVFEIKECLTALAFASIDGYTEIVEKICKSKQFKASMINFQDSYGVTALIHASGHGRVDTVAFLLSMSADCSVSSKSRGTALHLAAEKGSHEITKMLLEHNCPVNKCDNYGNTALMIASQYGHVEVVREILKHKPELNTANTEDYTALLLATAQNSLDVVKLLVQNGAEVDKINKLRQNALAMAVTKRYLEIAKYLIKNRAKCEFSLYVAITEGCSEIIAMLLNSDDIRDHERHDDSFYSIPLSLAAKEDRFIILQALLQRVVTPNQNKKYLKKGLRHSKTSANRPALLTQSADILQLEKTPMYQTVSLPLSYKPKSFEIMSLKIENNKISTVIDTISINKCDLHFNEQQMSTLFYLADNMHFLVLEPSFYRDIYEKRSFCFWVYLYFAIENERNFETIRTRIINFEAKLSQCSASTINPTLLNYEKVKGSLICIRSLNQAKIDTKSNSPSPEEIQKYMLAVMEEYAAMVKFEPFQFYVHQKCLHMLAKVLTAKSATCVDDTTLKSYTELTTRHLREHKVLDIFQENSSIPITHNTLQTILLLTKLYQVVAMNFAEGGLVTLLSKQFRKYTRSKTSANFVTEVTQQVVKIALEILLTISHYEENKQYFVECQTLEILKKRFPTSKFKQDIIILISSISNQANELPNLSDVDIEEFIDTSLSSLLDDKLVANWLRGLRLVAEKYQSSIPQFRKLFSILTKTLSEARPYLKELAMSLVTVISATHEGSKAIAQDQDLLKVVNFYQSSNTHDGNEARVINWNTCCASGNAASIPGTPDVYSQDFPRNFEIKDQLDRGSFGTVYLVTDLDKPDEKAFVAKQIWIEAKQDTIDSLFAETNILLNATNENIVQMHGYQIKNMSIFIFMEYMQKGTLTSYIKENNGLKEEKTCLFTKQILQ